MIVVGEAMGHLPTLPLNLKEVTNDKGLHPNFSSNLHLPN